MKCKDCVHYDACKNILVKAFPKTTETEIEAVCNREGGCSIFKPKSRFVELPCEVGQTVYAEVYGKITPFVVYKVKIVMTGNEPHFYYEATNEYPMFFEKENIGKTVFLSREEAEKALKEREKKLQD